jgi:putative ABC transport system permease protein
MIKNYFKIAWRNLRKNKISSFINIGGLAVGMAVAMLIGLWIYDETSFDKNFFHYDRIAQVIQNVSSNGAISTINSMPAPLGGELRKSYGNDLRYITMASNNGSHVLEYGEKKLSQNGTYFEPQALEIFSVKMLRGTRAGLNDPASILLSETLAKTYFGNTDPMGRIMKLDNLLEVKVRGVYEDLPDNSSFADMHFIAPWELFSNKVGLKTAKDPWRCNCFLIYSQVADHADMNTVSQKIKDVKLSKINKGELNQKPAVFLYPMSRWHLYSEFTNGVITGGRIRYVRLFGVIGAFVLLLACINFMNLSTARSEKRAKEVGIRKSIGSRRLPLICQFFCESLMTTFFAFILSLLLAWLILPFFNEVSGKKMSLLWGHPLFWLGGLAFCVFTGLVAGSYPALYLSSFKPVLVLKGVFRVGRFAAVPRRILVVLQFTVSVSLIVGTIIVFRQIRYAQDRPVGYNRDGLVTLFVSNGQIHTHFDAVQNDLKKAGAIASIAEAGSPTTAVWETNAGFDWKGKDPGLAVQFPNIDVSYDYGKTVGWQFTDGRDFSKDFLTDSAGFVMNESAAKFMGLKNPVGEIIKWDGNPYTVIGVIRDMVVESPYEPVRPSLFHLSRGATDVVLARINPSISVAEGLHTIETVFKIYNPAQPFNFQFTDEMYARKFRSEQRVGKLAGFFAILAIFISCLGLFGMASFVAEQRRKEIGLRKIMGASVFNLWRLLSKEFVALVLISLLIASPLAWFFMHRWLQNYAYHTALSWWVFMASGMGALLITLLTVSFQAIRAALANPVRSLRTE